MAPVRKQPWNLAIKEWSILEPEQGPINHLLIGLPGRGNTAEMMLNVSQAIDLPNTALASITPFREQWYPMPHSATDQEAAVAGLPKARQVCNSVIDRLQTFFNIPYNKIILLGYSAGGVMVNEIITNTDKTFAASVVLCGAILEPNSVQKAQNQTPHLIVHHRNDICFDWEERYLPMRQALRRKGYNLRTSEDIGDHGIYREDVAKIRKFLVNQIGI